MQAVQKRHSTFNEALSLAEECKARVTVLTHFSQRYPKLLPGVDLSRNTHIVVAHDGLCLDLGCAVPCPAIQRRVELALKDEGIQECTEQIPLPDSD